MNREQLLQDTYRRYVTEGLLPGFSSSSGCMYKTPGGARCALGHCIPDTEPDMLACSGGATELQDESPAAWKRVFGGLSVRSAEHVQRAHDDAAKAANPVLGRDFKMLVKRNLKKLAQEWKVKLP